MIPVILAGGQGTRLWPFSRRSLPKQFCQIMGDKSLFQSTALRAMQLSISPIIITNEQYFFLCQDQLRELGIKNAHFILEPCPRNTAPAIGLAAQYLKKLGRGDEWMVVMPSDHWIPDEQKIIDVVAACCTGIANDCLVTMGVKPLSPETGYGYIEAVDPVASNLFQVNRFIEKPPLDQAKALVSSGTCYWNSGIFIFTADALLRELSVHATRVLESVESALLHEAGLNYSRVNEDFFSACPSVSIDYAVMEKSDRVMMAVYDSDWSDLGSWSAIADIKQQDEQGNSVSGQVILEDTEDCLVEAGDQLIATLGMRGCAIIATDDAVLVADKSRTQDVKKLVQTLKLGQHQSIESHKKVLRPWGFYKQLAKGENYQVKHLMIKPGGSISLQLHYHRAEHWVVVAGLASIVKGEEILSLTVNESIFIPAETQHRLSNHADIPLHVIEVQSGSYLGEDDIVRFEDIYGRINETVVTT